jgi:hypothetical protein
MTHILLVTIEVDEAQLERLNQGRRRLNQQLHTATDLAENAIVVALQSPVYPSVKVRELQIATRSLRAPKDAYANA